MSKVILSKTEKESLKFLYKTVKHKREANKINSILLLSSGYDYIEVSKILLLDERSIRTYENIYLTSGLDGLIENNYKGKQTKLSSEQEIELTKHLEENLYHTSEQIVEYIHKKYDVIFTPDGLVITLHRLGFVYKKTKLVPAKADKEKQVAHLKKYKELRENHKEDEAIYFIDPVHPTHNVMPAHGWIKKGQEKNVKSNPGRDRVNLHGAYSPVNNDIIIREDETINKETTIEFFKQIEKKNQDKRKIYLILDNAKYYRANLVRDYVRQSKIELIFLPTYSPNLNLIERLWKLFKKMVLYNRYYEKFPDFKKAVFNFFEKEIFEIQDKLKSLMTENFKVISV